MDGGLRGVGNRTGGLAGGDPQAARTGGAGLTNGDLDILSQCHQQAEQALDREGEADAEMERLRLLSLASKLTSDS